MANKYTRKFETHNDYLTALTNSELVSPNVSYCKLDIEVHYGVDYSLMYFTVEALESGNIYFKYLSFASTDTQRYIEYSKDNGKTWTRTVNEDDNEIIMTISLNAGETAIIRGDNDSFRSYNSEMNANYGSNFYSDINVNVYGNIMSLLYNDLFDQIDTLIDELHPESAHFKNLFYDSWYAEIDEPARCNVVDAENLILPVKTLSPSSYEAMFYECVTLTKAPSLPADNLNLYCYKNMFTRCTSLVTAPKLPATTMMHGCYEGMFNGCLSLVNPPELPATTLENICYKNMFARCSSLVTAPELPAITIPEGCYAGMFLLCPSLNYIKAMFTTTPTTHTIDWVYGVAATGTFVKNSAASWDVTGVNGIPTGWDVETADE